MTRYREMTNEELIAWALEFRTNDRAAGKLIYALTMRVKAHDREASTKGPGKPEEPAKPRGHLTLATLSREAKAWLREHRPERWKGITRAAFDKVTQPALGAYTPEDIARQQAWTNSQVTHGCLPLQSVALTSTNGCHYRVCGGCGRRL